MTIGLCLIVKDEIDYLQACVSSVRDQVDQVVIVDTGSTDGTAELARRLADTYGEFSFAENFAAARNEALALAKTDWILFLDADEQVPKASAAALRGLVDAAPPDLSGMTLQRYNFFRNAGFYSSPELKLHRRSDKIRYQRAINESVVESIEAAGGRITRSGLLLNHFGHCRSLASREVKAAKYLANFDEQSRRHPDDPFFYAFQALILRSLGRMKQAQELAGRAVSLAPGSPVVRMFAGHVTRAAGDPRRTLEAYRHALSFAPSDPALLNLVGVALIELGLLEEAIGPLRTAAADPSCPHAEINLGLVAQGQERWTDAGAHFRRALRANPAFGHYQWSSHLEADYFRATHFEVPFGYHGLVYHLSFVDGQATGRDQSW